MADGLDVARRRLSGQLAVGVIVSYAKQQPPDNHDDQAGPGNGIIDEFDTSGNFIKRFATGGTLNSPIGMVGNFGDSRVNDFDATTGFFLGQLTDTQGNPLVSHALGWPPTGLRLAEPSWGSATIGAMPGTYSSWRVLIAAVVLPAAIAWADQLGIDFANSQRWRGPATVLLFGGFMFQTAVLSCAIGRWLPNWGWRFGVLAWALVLTNLLLLRAIIEGGDGSPWGDENPVLLLTTAFMAAQVSAVAVCFVLVSVSLGKKTLITGAALAPLATAVSGLIVDAYFWATVMLIQVIATMLLAAVLRARGWQIVQLDAVNRASRGVWLQFSIRHMLVVTMAAALLTVFGKAVVIHSAAGMDWKHWLQGTIDGCTLGVLSLVAVWAALSTGRAAVRLVLLLLLAMLLAGQLWWAEETAASMFLPAGGPMLSTIFWFRQALAGPWWLAWTLLASTFLASWLSVLRATGYRLVRQRGT